MNACARKGYLALLLIAAVCILPRFCPAQATPVVTRPPSPSRVDLFGGYGYLHPVNSDIYNQPYTVLNGGGIGSLTGYFNRSFGIDAEYAKFPDQPDYCFSIIQAGPVFRINLGRLVPFAHVIGGAAQQGPSYAHNGSSNPCAWGWAASMGLGVDYVLPGFHNRLAIRPIAGDFQLTSVNFGAQSPLGGFSGGVGQIFAVRLSAAFVIRLGGTTPEQPAAAIHLAPAALAAPPPPPGPQTLSGNYVIGADDSIRVEVFREPDLSATLPVRPDGKISLPLVGDVSAAGLTPMQLAADLTDRFKKFVTDPVVGVTVQAVNSNRIFLIGEVGHVGPLSMTPGMTVLQAIAAAGGLTPYANWKSIYILRGDPGKQQKIPFNYDKALKTGDMQRISLQTGDTIVVP
jgi:polysaccharide export outer membrane protein